MSDWSITVDLADVERAAALATPDLTQLADAVHRAAEHIRATWGQAVQGRMLPGMTKPVTNDAYYESLYTGRALQMITPLHGAVVSLYDGVAKIEQGYPAYDMKPGLLSGPSARRTKKGGRYTVVPFRFMTPKQGQSGHAHSHARAHGSVMPHEVYTIVKRSGTFVDPANARRGEQMGQRSKLVARLDLDSAQIGNYTWKSGLYTGMVRQQQTYGQRVQSTYWTYRAVSDASDPSAWIHPGQPPNPVIQAVIDATRDDVTAIVLAGARRAWRVD